MPAKPAFRIGKDRLAFTLHSSRAGYLYVLLLSDGNLTRLFPNTTAPDNLVRAGQKLKLPQETWAQDISGPVGTDHYLVIVSDQQRDFSGTGMVMDGGYGIFKHAAAEAAARQYTGPGSVLAGRSDCSPGCPDEYGAALFTVQVVN